MANLGANFYQKLVQVATNVGLRPEDLLLVMSSESGINPSALNNINAAGLIQLMPNTLKGLGFKGSPKDFTQLNGEMQLEYVEKFIKSLGVPLKSAAQYYVGNLFPIALRLPGVMSQDPNTIILEKHPATVKGSKNSNVKLSKKYFDAGLRLPAKMEVAAFVSNPLFSHGKNYVTFGDFQKVVEENKTRPSYIQAVKDLQASYKHQQQDEFDQYVNEFKDKLPSFDKKPETKFEQVIDKYIKANKEVYLDKKLRLKILQNIKG